jgi:HIV Tat-specific factor 1
MAETQPSAECTREKEKEKQDDSMKNYEFDGQTYVYTDKATNITYKFDQGSNKWVKKNDESDPHDKKGSDEPRKKGNTLAEPAAGIFGFENDTHTYTDPDDGSVYFWDKEKNAWFPKVDEDFMAKYQMSYGFTEASASPEVEPPKLQKQLAAVVQKTKEEKEQRRAEAKRKAQEPPSWFEVDEAHNTAIYVSGLPLDITLKELTELFTKCGLIARDEKGRDKIKLYKDNNGEPKGDALCTYIKVRTYVVCFRRLLLGVPRKFTRAIRIYVLYCTLLQI